MIGTTVSVKIASYLLCLFAGVIYIIPFTSWIDLSCFTISCSMNSASPSHAHAFGLPVLRSLGSWSQRVTKIKSKRDILKYSVCANRSKRSGGYSGNAFRSMGGRTSRKWIAQYPSLSSGQTQFFSLQLKTNLFPLALVFQHSRHTYTRQLLRGCKLDRDVEGKPNSACRIDYRPVARTNP